MTLQFLHTMEKKSLHLGITVVGFRFLKKLDMSIIN